MHDPLSADTVVSLRSDPTAALAASLILAGAFPHLVSWAMMALGGHSPRDCAKANGVGHGDMTKPKEHRSPHENGAGGSNGVKKIARPPEPRAKGSSGSPNLREAAAEHDQALLALMQANPEATVSELLRMSGRPRNSTQLSLERLEKAGLVEHASRGKWTVIDPDLLDPDLVEAPTPRPAGWVAPLSGAHVAKHSAGGRVRDELGMGARA